MSYPVSDQIEKVRRRLLGSRKSEVNYLNGAILAGATTITVEDDTVRTGLTRGVYIGIDSELMLVRSVAGQVVTVRRGQLGTIDAAHADDADVEIAPRFPRGDILDLIQDEILSWGPLLYHVPPPAGITEAGTGARAYDLNIGTFYDIIDVRREPNQPTLPWSRVRHFSIDRNAPLDSFPSGQAFYIHENLSSTTNLSVTYSQPFDTSDFTESTDLLVDCNLDPAFLDILTYGAMWRAMSGTEVPRTDSFSQGEPRSAEEVPPGHRINTASGLKKLRDQRIAEEQMRLYRKWGLRAG